MLSIIPSSNAKLAKNGRKKRIYTFSLPAGHACPFAKKCLSKSNRETGRITDGRHTEFRCFGATSEARSPSLRKSVWRNYDQLKATGLGNLKALKKLIRSSLPEKAEIIRIHTTGGDFMTKTYMRAWMEVARENPKVLFYGYTKAIHHLAALKEDFPKNFRITASDGGTYDHNIETFDLVAAYVVYSPEEAEELGLEIDHNDELAMRCTKSFALLIHGTQPAGSEASKALQKLKKRGVEHAYS